MSKEHTPTPWSQSHRQVKNGNYSTEIYDIHGETIAVMAWHIVNKGNGHLTTDREANAELIIKAVNNHDKLVDALKENNLNIKILREQLIDANKTNNMFDGMPELMQTWINRNKELIKSATELKEETK